MKPNPFYSETVNTSKLQKLILLLNKYIFRFIKGKDFKMYWLSILDTYLSE